MEEDKKPRCPECGDTEPVELPPKRVGFHKWLRRWHCLECGADFDGDDYYTPAKDCTVTAEMSRDIKVYTAKCPMRGESDTMQT